MPPRYVYWTILAGGLPTAFRAADREELLPTFHRIREKHPDAEMKWFARGKLWESPEAERNERPQRPGEAFQEQKRSRDWRPGGEHRDPRQKFADAKKQRNQDWRKERFERKQLGVERPRNDRDWRERPPGPNVGRPVEGRQASPKGSLPERDFRPRDKAWAPKREGGFREGGPPREKPHGDPLRPAVDGRGPRPPKRDFKPRGGERRDFKPREGGRRDFSPREGQQRDSRPPKRDFRPREGGFGRNQGVAEPKEPPRPRGPNREPHPDETPRPTPPPRPDEPITAPPGPPERGRKRDRR